MTHTCKLCGGEILHSELHLCSLEPAALLALAGRKDDSGKLRHDLIPPEAMDALATILTMGAAKYDDRNWEHGMSWGRIFGALMRHLWSWWGGEDNDPESGRSHLWHALTNVVFLLVYEQRKIGEDTRYKIKAEEPE